MSDLPNGTPPGQNNLDAGVEPYVPLANDPSAGAQKPDELRQKEDGIEPKDDTDPEVQKELDEAAKTPARTGSVEEHEEEDEEGQVVASRQQPPPQQSPKMAPKDSNETKDTKPGAAASTQRK